MLVDEGKLRWDDRVTRYIPELQLADPWATRELTIRDLLTHRTGLPGTDLFWASSWHYSLPEIIYRLRYVKPQLVVPVRVGVPERHVLAWRNGDRARLGDAVGRLRSRPHLYAARHERDRAARLVNHRKGECRDPACVDQRLSESRPDEIDRSRRAGRIGVVERDATCPNGCASCSTVGAWDRTG